MNKDFTIAVILSGRGSNFKSLLENQGSYRVIAALSDKEDAPGLAYAREKNIPVYTFARNKYENLSAQKEALYQKIRELAPSLIVLAGYMQLVAPHFTEEFAGKIINIHPSLLPALPGLHTHERAIQEGHKEHGCTVHLVDAGVDTGKVIAQAKVAVREGDTPESLSARVLEKEHMIYPWVLSMIAQGEICGTTSLAYSEVAKRESQQLGFLIKNN